MDVLKLISKQINEIKSQGHSAYLNLILNHLNRAENYYQKGQNDDHYYNDVVYRTNQAFEGALKEAYKVLSEKTEEEIIKTSPFKIEKYLKEGNVFKNRILILFENYRQEWRNKTTHDYKLILDEHEAFLALVNVCSFVHLLLKQIQEKIAFNKEAQKERTAGEIKEVNRIIKNKSSSLVDKILELISKFSESLNDSDRNLKEGVIIGKLTAFLFKVSDELMVYREPTFSSDNFYLIPDFIIETQNEKIVLEVKKKQNTSNLRASMNQMTSYLTISGINNGIIYFTSSKVSNTKMTTEIHSLTVNNTQLNIYIIY